MMKFKMPDGIEVEGETYDDIVRGMSNQKMNKPHSLKSYREAVGRRVSAGLGPDHEVRTDTSEMFVTDMVDVGLVKRLD